MSWIQIALIFGTSILITLCVFIGLVWRDYRRDRAQHPTRSLDIHDPES